MGVFRDRKLAALSNIQRDVELSATFAFIAASPTVEKGQSFVPVERQKKTVDRMQPAKS